MITLPHICDSCLSIWYCRDIFYGLCMSFMADVANATDNEKAQWRLCNVSWGEERGDDVITLYTYTLLTPLLCHHRVILLEGSKKPGRSVTSASNKSAYLHSAQ